MNKRLTALLLCLVMMLSVFLAGCAESSEEDAKEELEQAKVASNMTLTMWIVSESPVAESIRADVTKAINVLTKAKYKTQLEIYYLSEEEYFEKVTDAMEEYTAAKKQQSGNKPAETGTTAEEGGTTAEEIITDENGMYRDNYPIVLQNQVDIIYIGDVGEMSGQEMYNELRAGDWLAALDETIKGDAKKLKEFVSPTLLSAVQEKGVTYAIPNNNIISEYTFMCLNKTLMDRYSLQGHLTRGSIKSFANEYVYQFIDQIARYESNILPIDATYEDCLAQLAYYWNIDPENYSINSDEFSIFGTPLFNMQPNRGQNAIGVQSLFENEEFTKHYLAINEYRIGQKYHYLDTDEENPIVFFRNEENKDVTYDAYGVKFVKGTLAELNAKGNYVDPKTGVEYYAVPVSYPKATADDIYGNMFAVASTTLSVERSMQIITYLNTNAEFRNLLQYGIEGQHYTIENGYVARVADKNGNYYEMDIDVTGNTFIAHLEPGLNAAIWENGKNQNRDSLVEPLLGFNLSEYAQTATQFGTPITATNTKTYSTTFRSGLNKNVLSEDPILKAWLDTCDADVEEKGTDGVYVFRSREKTLNNEYSEILYFYNTAGAYRFGVESEEVPKETGTGYYRNNTYTYTEDNSLFGSYTLTMVYDVCMTRYEGSYKVVQKVMDEDGENEVSRTELAHTEAFLFDEQKYDFDIYNTESYKMTVYGDLYLSDFYDNKDIFNELVKLYEGVGASTPTNRGLYWKTTDENKAYHSFLIYRKDIKNTTTVDIVPVVSGNQIKLVVNYNEYKNSEIKDPDNYGQGVVVRPGKRYTLYYVVLETDLDAVVNAKSISYGYSATTQTELENGPLVNEFLKDSEKDTYALIEIGTETPISFDAKGMLNTEVVKYMAELNTLVMDLLNSCKTPAELKKMVGYLATLLNTEEKLVTVYKNYPEINENNPAPGVDASFIAVVKKNSGTIVSEENFEELFYQLTHITNYGTMEDVKEGLTRINEMKEAKNDEFRPAFYSPYGIYYLWMEAYQYLPADMQPTE